MKKWIMIFLMGTIGAFAYNATTADVSFTAFKTPAKKGVEGKFEALNITAKKDAATVEALLEGMSVTIPTKAVNSGNKERDAKLVNLFFNVQSNEKIDAKIVSVKADTLVVEITMNKKTLPVPMSYKVKENQVVAQGYIDLGDFQMLPSLKSINKACFALHEGKTWQDVSIAFSLHVQ